MNLHNVEFIKSAADEKDFIRDGLPQIVFSGKSNVGKSSVINRLLNRKNMAKTGSTPGKTTHINYFLIDGRAYFADLPGYGYAKVSKKEKERWSRLMESYFDARSLISLGIMIVDCRHKPTSDDKIMADWFRLSACPLIVVANKADKVGRSELEGNIRTIKSTLELAEDTVIMPFSAAKGAGRDELISEIMRNITEAGAE